jgi:ribokinase
VPKQPRIAVAGSANIDLTTFTDRFPRAGETIFGSKFQLGFGGKGANQAVAAALCGADVSMIARVGDDLFGPATIDNFRSRGIDTLGVKITPGVSSGVAPIFVDSAGENRIIVVSGANGLLTPEDIDDAASLLWDIDCLVLQLEVPLPTVYQALRFAHANGIRCVLNPAPGQPLDLAQATLADYLIPNETEAEILTGMPVKSIEDAHACAARLQEQGFTRVILTLGANGAVFAGADGARHIPAHRVQPVDTSGAGDAFIGSFATFLASGIPEEEAIARANVYAALSTLGVGTQRSFPTRAQFTEVWAAKNA